jgi:WD40 repeat protein
MFIDTINTSFEFLFFPGVFFSPFIFHYALLALPCLPPYSRTVYDALNDEKIVLTDEELSIINRIRKGKFPHRDFDPYADYSAPIEVEIAQLHNPQEPKRRWQPSKWEAKKVVKLVHSLRNGWLRDPQLPPEKKQEFLDEVFDLWGDEQELSEKEKARRTYYAPPRRAPPGHVESFNPPPEYLLTEAERDEEEAKEPEHRRFPFLPTVHSSLRAVPAYEKLVRERFERCLDLYLCVREKREKKSFFDVEKLIPQLPKPKDLRPFPTALSLEYVGHTGSVRSLDVSPCGQWLVSGSEDGTVRVWEVSTARCARVWNMKERVVSVAWNPNPSLPLVAAALSSGVAILHTGTGSPDQGANAEHLLRAAPVLFKRGTSIARAAESASERGAMGAVNRATRMAKLVHWVSWWRRAEADIEEEFAPEEDGRDAAGVDAAAKTREALAVATLAKRAEAGLPINATDKEVKALAERIPATSADAAAATAAAAAAAQKKKRAAASEAADAAEAAGEDFLLSLEDAAEWDATQGLARLFVRIKAGVSCVAWHGKGDYLATVSPVATSTAVFVHRLSAAASQLPFTKSKGLVQQVAFHPTQPHFIVATQRQIRTYSLLTQKSAKTLRCPTKWVSSFAVHPRGEHVVIGGYDRKVSWFDFEQAGQPYKTLRYHRRGVRAVAFHKRYPLFVTGSDDGCLHVMHATVYDDMVTDPLIVPVKIINAHIPVEDVGVLSAVFHPNQPWVFSAAADKTIRLFS